MPEGATISRAEIYAFIGDKDTRHRVSILFNRIPIVPAGRDGKIGNTLDFVYDCDELISVCETRIKKAKTASSKRAYVSMMAAARNKKESS